MAGMLKFCGPLATAVYSSFLSFDVELMHLFDKMTTAYLCRNGTVWCLQATRLRSIRVAFIYYFSAESCIKVRVRATLPAFEIAK